MNAEIIAARVSRDTQNLDRQIDALKKYGVDKIYNEKMTGTKNVDVMYRYFHKPHNKAVLTQTDKIGFVSKYKNQHNPTI